LEQLEQAARRLTYSFGSFLLDPAERRLALDGRDLRLSPKVFETLVLLVERHGLLVDKDDLMKALWPGTFVEEVTLARNISLLRKALGDAAGQDQSQYIETVSKRGYRFIADVKEIYQPAAQSGGSLEGDSESVAPGVFGTWWRHRRAWIVAVGFVLLVMGIAASWRFKVLHQSSGPIRSLAVLPLENLSGDPDQEYFVDGMTDELITDLAQIHSLRVISRTSVMQFKHTKKTLPEIAKELNVDAVVQGSVSRSGSDVHITAQLLDARQDRHLWAASYERQMADIVSLQTQVATAIANQVKANLTPEENARLKKIRPVNPQAYDAYLKGLYIENRKHAEPPGKAVGYLEQAVTIDPNYAEAWAQLGNSYVFFSESVGAKDRPAIISKARAAIGKALELDPKLSVAYASSGVVKMWYDWDWAGANRDLKRAIELDPNSSVAHRYYAHYLMLHRRFDEALEENKLAIDLAPFEILATAHLTQLYRAEHQPDKVIEVCKRVLEMDPAHTGVYGALADAYAAKGQWAEAIGTVDHLQELHLIGRIGYLVEIAPIWAGSGDKVRADAAMAEVKEFAKHHEIPSLVFAYYEARFGDRDEAFQWLEKAYQERDPGLGTIEIEVSLDNLRSDPRFQDLERRVGFR
jgi:TolB-like protein/DNA-binding winged helix-turn-helix (wHTH) protein/cytochrome c-type biogenesis protein CcmH/NrfG